MKSSANSFFGEVLVDVVVETFGGEIVFGGEMTFDDLEVDDLVDVEAEEDVERESRVADVVEF